MEIRPQIAGRPTGILQGLTSSFHIFAGHPTYKSRDRAPAAGREGGDDAAAGDPRRAAGRGAAPSATAPMAADPSSSSYRVFPLGERPNYEPDRSGSVGGLAEAAGVTPMEMMYDLLIRDGGTRAVLPAAGRLLHLQLRLLPQEHAAPQRAVRPLRRRRPLRRDRRRRHADLHPHPLGARPHQGRAVPARVPGPQADPRHGDGLRACPTAAS